MNNSIRTNCSINNIISETFYANYGENRYMTVRAEVDLRARNRINNFPLVWTSSLVSLVEKLLFNSTSGTGRLACLAPKSSPFFSGCLRLIKMTMNLAPKKAEP
jgi:hypothetical protein